MLQTFDEPTASVAHVAAGHPAAPGLRGPRMEPVSSGPAAVRLFNGRFNPVTLDSCVDTVFNDMARGRRGWLCTVNVAILMMMREDTKLQSFVDRASWTVADGQPLIWAARWFRRALPERVTGVDLVYRLCERAEQQGQGVYLLGATSTTVRRLAERLQARYPALILSYADGYFSADEAEQRADAVALSGASILLVGMGVPRQEHFIESQFDRLGVQLAVGVGGSFDVLAGLRSRAPQWMQNAGLEWLFRLVQEPRRLFKRYLLTNSKFVGLLLRALVLPRHRDC